MRLTTFFVRTLKEDPQDAEVISHKLMIRAGLIQRLGSGSYTWLPLGMRILHKLTNIIRQRMNEAGALELLMPIVQPASLWEKSGRWHKYGPELLRLNDRHNRPHCLAPTHEEVITEVARNELHSYRQLPVNFYQIQTKFRDEIRPRFGVMRAREFTMKDAYSFHASEECFLKTYEKMREAYCSIFSDCGLRYCVVEADSGAIGGSASHEFHVLSEVGEDAIAFSTDDSFAARNAELIDLSDLAKPPPPAQQDLVKKPTPNVKTIADLTQKYQLTPQQTLKTIVVQADRDHIDSDMVALLVRGDHMLNARKATLHPWVKNPIEFCSEQDIRATFKAGPGSLGPYDCPVPCLVDYSASCLADFSSGANEDDHHYFGLNWGRDVALPPLADLRMATSGDPAPDGAKGVVEIERGIEVGHIFQLDQTYSKPMEAQFTDESGRPDFFVMGCYGIGVSRVIAAAIEQNHDESGIIWSESLAPFEVIILALNYGKSEAVRQHADQIYRALVEARIDVVLDDRDIHPGEKFADADLIGIPHQITVGDRGLKNSIVEYRQRRVSKKQEIALTEITAHVLKTLKPEA